LRSPMSNVEATNAAGEIDELIAIHIPNHCSFSSGYENGCDLMHTSWHSSGPALHQ